METGDSFVISLTNDNLKINMQGEIFLVASICWLFARTARKWNGSTADMYTSIPELTKYKVLSRSYRYLVGCAEVFHRVVSLQPDRFTVLQRQLEFQNPPQI